MNNNDDLDLIERISQNLYHRSSRRGFLSTFGKALLGFIGVTVLEPLPLDRTTKVDALRPVGSHNPHNCNYWKYCSINSGGWTPCICCS